MSTLSLALIFAVSAFAVIVYGWVAVAFLRS